MSTTLRNHDDITSDPLLDNAIDVYDPKQLDSLTKQQLKLLPCGTIRVGQDAIITNREPPAVAADFLQA